MTVEIDAIGEEISRTRAAQAAPIFVVSGRAGASGGQPVRTTVSSIETGHYWPSALLAFLQAQRLAKRVDEIFYLEEGER